MSRSQFFFQCLNATIPLASALENEYPSSNETSKKNGTVRGDCIACDALLVIVLPFKHQNADNKIYKVLSKLYHIENSKNRGQTP